MPRKTVRCLYASDTVALSTLKSPRNSRCRVRHRFIRELQEQRSKAGVCLEPSRNRSCAVGRLMLPHLYRLLMGIIKQFVGSLVLRRLCHTSEILSSHQKDCFTAGTLPASDLWQSLPISSQISVCSNPRGTSFGSYTRAGHRRLCQLIPHRRLIKRIVGQHMALATPFFATRHCNTNSEVKKLLSPPAVLSTLSSLDSLVDIYIYSIFRNQIGPHKDRSSARANASRAMCCYCI